MKTTSCVLIVLCLCLMAIVPLSSCKTGSSDNGNGHSPTDEDEVIVLVDQDVNVPGGGGGSGEILFTLISGQTIRITLTAVNNTNMLPYGWLESLEYPQGPGSYSPPLETAQNGTNSVELEITQWGLYALVVLDGANIGGTVHVKVEVL